MGLSNVFQSTDTHRSHRLIVDIFTKSLLDSQALTPEIAAIRGHSPKRASLQGARPKNKATYFFSYERTAENNSNTPTANCISWNQLPIATRQCCFSIRRVAHTCMPPCRDPLMVCTVDFHTLQIHQTTTE